MDLPLGLATALESGNCVLFVGAGAGHEMLTPSGSPAPAGNGLADALAHHFEVDAGDTHDLAIISQIVENRHGRAKLIARVERELSKLQPSDDLRWLASLTWKAIFTTNYDDAIERSYDRLPNPTQTPVPIATNSDVTQRASTSKTVWQVRLPSLKLAGYGCACGGLHASCGIRSNDG